MVAPKADGKVRLAADYRLTVNPKLDTVKYPLPSPKELFARLKENKFAKLEMRNAYLQMKLNEESKDLTAVTIY